MATLLSGGALVISERSCAADESEFHGLVSFVNASLLVEEYERISNWSARARAAVASERSTLFRTRFAPTTILERSGVACLFRRLLRARDDGSTSLKLLLSSEALFGGQRHSPAASLAMRHVKPSGVTIGGGAWALSSERAAGHSKPDSALATTGTVRATRSASSLNTHTVGVNALVRFGMSSQGKWGTGGGRHGWHSGQTTQT